MHQGELHHEPPGPRAGRGGRRPGQQEPGGQAVPRGGARREARESQGSLEGTLLPRMLMQYYLVQKEFHDILSLLHRLLH